MPKNPNTKLENRHVCVIGSSGAGKSQVLKNLIPGRGVRVLAWDPDEDHKVSHFGSVTEWAKHVLAALKSGKAFRLGVRDGTNRKEFERFCQGAFDALDGNHETHVILEEAARYTQGSGPADEHLGNLLQRGRKYGAICWTVGQRAAELPTTVRRLSDTVMVGYVAPDDRKAAADLLGISPEKVAEIEPGKLEFWIRVPGKEPVKKRFKYKG